MNTETIADKENNVANVLLLSIAQKFIDNDVDINLFIKALNIHISKLIEPL